MHACEAGINVDGHKWRAGKLLGNNPWSEHAVELQRALTKATNTTVVLQPPAVDTAVHMLCVLQRAETDAAARAPTESQEPFISFDDTYVMYGYLLGHHMPGALLICHIISVASPPPLYTHTALVHERGSMSRATSSRYCH